jgi:hypothetical protein
MLFMKPTRRFIGIGLLLLLMAGVALAQRRRGGWGSEGYIPNADTIKTAREAPSHSTGTPEWTNTTGFSSDAFTFARVRYSQGPYGSSRGNWTTDFPDSDLNLSFRLQQMTSIKVDPNGRVLDLTDKALFDYPWIYMVEPGSLLLSDEEVAILRKYLLNGGFLMADDFWGEDAWRNFYREMKRVFPERELAELPMDHPIFHSVFSLRGPKNKLQIPNKYQAPQSDGDNETWEYHNGEACREVHIKALFDDKNRMMVIATHNTDNGDGWEREGEDDYFFHRFSENIAFPLGINIIYYVMTH